MSKKIIIFSLILFSTLMTTSLLGALAPTTAPNLINQRDNTLNVISHPESSAATITEKWNYNTDPRIIEQVVISSDGNYIAISYQNSKNVTLFHRDSNVTLWEFEAANNIDEIAISWNGTYVVACCQEYAYLLNSTEENPKTTMWNFTTSSAVDYCVDISLDGNYIAVGTAQDGEGAYLLNNIYSSENKQEIWKQEWVGPTPQSHSISISGDSNYTVSGDRNVGWVTVYNETKINPKKREWRYDTTNLVNDVEMSHKGDYFIAANDDNEVYLFNTTDYQGIPVWNFTANPAWQFQGIAISADGNYSIAAFAGRLYYFNNTFSGVTSQKEPFWELNLGEGIEDIDMSADGKYIVAATSSIGTLYLLNSTKTTPKIEEWSAFDGDQVNAVSINALGDYFVAGVNKNSNVRGLWLYHHQLPTTSIPPGGGGDDDDDDDDDTGAVVVVVVIVIIVSIGGVVFVIIVLIKKGIIDITKFKRG